MVKEFERGKGFREVFGLAILMGSYLRAHVEESCEFEGPYIATFITIDGSTKPGACVLCIILGKRWK